MSQGYASLTIPMLQQGSDGVWHGDILSGWDQSGLIKWGVRKMEEYRRRTVSEAMTRAALSCRFLCCRHLHDVSWLTQCVHRWHSR